MIEGMWETRYVDEFDPFCNTKVTFLSNGTGWFYLQSKNDSYTISFNWLRNENGNINITGEEILNINGDKRGSSELLLTNVSYDITKSTQNRIERITFASPLINGKSVFGLDTRMVPSIKEEMNEQELITEYIKFLHWHTPYHYVEQAFKKLLLVDEKYMFMLVQPISKPYWDNAALLLSKFENTNLESVIPGLIEWMEDMNWPGARTAAKLLVNLGDPVIKHLKRYLLGSDDQTVIWILNFIIDEWPTGLDIKVKEELQELTRRVNSYDDVNFEAESILKKHQLI